jgi:hypothetical protein
MNDLHLEIGTPSRTRREEEVRGDFERAQRIDVGRRREYQQRRSNRCRNGLSKFLVEGEVSAAVASLLPASKRDARERNAQPWSPLPPRRGRRRETPATRSSFEKHERTNLQDQPTHTTARALVNYLKP